MVLLGEGGGGKQVLDAQIPANVLQNFAAIKKEAALRRFLRFRSFLLDVSLLRSQLHYQRIINSKSPHH